MSGSPFLTIQLSDPRYESLGIRHATVHSRALGRRADCSFWAPVGAGDALHLVVLLHGVYASHWAWIGCGGAHRIAQQLTSAGGVAPFCLAMPSDSLYGHGSGYVTSQAGDVERWIVDEVPALAALAVPGVDAGAEFSLVGLSMGGFGALSIAAWNPGRVRAAVGMSSITHFDQMELFVGALGDYRVREDRRSVLGSVLANRDRLPRIRIDCGSDDLLIDHNRALHASLDDAAIAHVWAEYDGAHDWEYWHAHLSEAIRFCC